MDDNNKSVAAMINQFMPTVTNDDSQDTAKSTKKALEIPLEKGTAEEPEFCTPTVALSPNTITGACLRQQARSINPLPGGAEAEGFGVGGSHEDPTSALRDRCRCGEGFSSLHPLPRGDSQVAMK